MSIGSFILTSDEHLAADNELRALRRDLECRRLLALCGGPGQASTVAVGEASQPTVERQGVIDPASAQVQVS